MNLEYCKIEQGTRVLVTGATGFTGSVLTHKLSQAGLKINAIARHSSMIQELSDIEVNWFRGDVFDPDVVLPAAEGCRYIFHVAAAYREAKLSSKDYWNVHVRSTQHLAEADSCIHRRLASTAISRTRQLMRTTPSNRATSIRKQKLKRNCG